MKKILIANRGEIARRVMRTCRDMGIATVAVCSEPDREAPFVREADEVVPLAGSSSAETYLNVEALLHAAKLTGADGVHPGYGFLSENADFARRVGQAGLTFIGPTPEAIAAMGSKIEAKRRMQNSGVSVLPSVAIGKQSAADLAREAAALGPAILVKASAGGGGRGMRIVRTAAELPAAVEAAQREARSAFGDETVFLEPYVDAPRHIEVQIFGDTHGNIVHLLERECSIQRRHQKIIEEAPSPALDEELRAAICSAAVRAGEAIGYTNAGTVEFLLGPDRKFYFLEVNTRLQVEHPVTEEILGLDLVRLQILVAEGHALPQEVWHAKPRGHAIEVRLYAEDPAQGYAPSTGKLHRFDVPPGPGVRIESGVVDGSTITSYYDPMLAKLIVRAPTRAEAARALSATLARAQIHGPRTNRELLVHILRHPQFLAGETDTHFLERHPATELSAPLCDAAGEKLHAAAAALAAAAERQASATVLSTIPSGWRNNPSQPEIVKFRGVHGEIEVAYRWARGVLSLATDGAAQPNPRVGRCTAELVELETASILRSYHIHHVGDTFYVDSPLGSSALVELPRFPTIEEEVQPGSLVAPLPGVVDAVKVNVGDQVAAGDVLVVIESMKMLYPVTAPAAGRVTELRVQKAMHVEARTVLAVIEEQM
ncbi:MAG TPA: biotin carboxylase N-terminal domain-containing protein [Pirellulales bacterium]|nr:biotin carboxylase N-terminal domain-containing protein [Pirellulales bacterium]